MNAKSCFRLVLVVLFSFFLGISHQASYLEIQALSAFYYATNGANWSNNQNWLNGDPCTNSWHGVGCSSGNVISLALPSDGLTGSLTPVLSDLTNLSVLNLSGNQISGTIPNSLSSLFTQINSALGTLNLANNALLGTYPTFLFSGGFSSAYINLASNTFCCPVPAGCPNCDSGCKKLTPVCNSETISIVGGSAAVSASQLFGGLQNANYCPTTTYTYAVSPTSYTCSNLGNQSPVLTLSPITPGTAYTTTCTAAVSVVDTTAPSVTCKNYTVTLASGTGTITSANVVASSSDNCGSAPTIALSKSSFGCSDIGVVPVTVSATDSSQNKAICISYVTVQYLTLPTVSCTSYTAKLDLTGKAVITPNLLATYSATCGSVSATTSVSQVTCANIPSAAVIVNVADAFGNANSCTATVTVADANAPVITCAPISVYLNLTGSVVVSSSYAASATATCGTAPVLTPPTATFTCSNIGPNNGFLVTATDQYSNVATCTATVNVINNNQPNLTCLNPIVQINSTGQASINASLVSTVTTTCGTASVVLNTTTFNCFSTGIEPVLVTAIDAQGNVVSCVANVTVQNLQVPNITCGSATVYLNSSGLVSLNPFLLVNSSAICGPVNLTANQSTFSCANIGKNNIFFTSTDTYNNTNNCSAVVTVIDPNKPNIYCQNISVSLDQTGHFSLGNISSIVASNATCGNVTVTSNVTSFSCANIGNNSVLLSSADAYSNTNNCTSNIFVQDLLPPNITCVSSPVSATINSSGVVYVSPSSLTSAVSDNCVTYLLKSNISLFTCANVGNNTVLVNATDASNNTANCTAPVTIVAPTFTITCNAVTAYLNASGIANITAAQLFHNSTFHCGNLSLSVNVNTFSCANLGNNPVTLTATDPYGNSATCNTNVNVSRSFLPTVTCAPNVTVLLSYPNFTTNLTVANVQGIISDQCAVNSSTLSATTYGLAAVSLNPSNVTLTETDVGGATFSCSSTVFALVNGLLNPGGELKNINTKVTFTWDNTLTNFNSVLFAKTSAVTLYYINNVGATVYITQSAINYSVGTYTWTSGFPATLPLNRFYSVFMTLNGHVADIAPIYLI